MVRPNTQGLRPEKNFWESVQDSQTVEREEETEISKDYVSGKQQFWSKTAKEQVQKGTSEVIKPIARKEAMKSEKKFWENVTDIKKDEKKEAEDYEVGQDELARRQQLWSKAAASSKTDDKARIRVGELKEEKEFWEHVKEDSSKAYDRRSQIEAEGDYVSSRQEFWSGVGGDEANDEDAKVRSSAVRRKMRKSWMTEEKRQTEGGREMVTSLAGDAVNGKQIFWSRIGENVNNREMHDNFETGAADVEAKQKFWALKATKGEDDKDKRSAQEVVGRSDVSERRERYRASCKADTANLSHLCQMTGEQLRRLEVHWLEDGEDRDVRSSPVWATNEDTTVLEKATLYDESLEQEKDEKGTTETERQVGKLEQR